ncbi:MAG: sigma-70 family RNA polymerase sigma factor [Chloroflexota bacterium]
MAKRTNDQWLDELRSDGHMKDSALADLRQILISGLRRGLLSQVNTSAPEFETQAEDFVQEALLKILDNLDSFAGRSRFTTWAHKIAVSVALTELRRKRWQDSSLDGILETESGDYTPSFVADPAPRPEGATVQADMLRRVNNIITNELTEKQRTALTASIIQELPTAQVAKMMNMKPNAVYKLLHDARVRLKKQLQKEGLSVAEVISAFR